MGYANVVYANGRLFRQLIVFIRKPVPYRLENDDTIVYFLRRRRVFITFSLTCSPQALRHDLAQHMLTRVTNVCSIIPTLKWRTISHASAAMTPC